MKALKLIALVVSTIACCMGLTARAESTEKVLLTDGWAIQSADQVSKPGKMISKAALTPENWSPATVPSTVAGTLVDDKIYPDPFFGMNLKDLSTNSAFKGPWWDRKEFNLRTVDDGQILLHFDGINYLAD